MSSSHSSTDVTPGSSTLTTRWSISFFVTVEVLCFGSTNVQPVSDPTSSISFEDDAFLQLFVLPGSLMSNGFLYGAAGS